MNRRKRIKVIGKWAVDRGYDAWDIFIGRTKWTRLMAVTKDPIGLMLRRYPFANINWNTVKAVKLT